MELFDGAALEELRVSSCKDMGRRLGKQVRDAREVVQMIRFDDQDRRSFSAGIPSPIDFHRVLRAPPVLQTIAVVARPEKAAGRLKKDGLGIAAP